MSLRARSSESKCRCLGGWEVKQLPQFALFLLFGFAISINAAAQDYPWPTHTSQAASVCPQNILNNGQPTNDTKNENPDVDVIRSICPNYPNSFLPQYSGPLTRFVGRYVDSNRVPAFQAGYGMRTLRAEKVIVATDTNRVYMIIGSTFAQWDIGSFFSKIGVEPLIKNTYYGAGIYRAGRNSPNEKYLGFEGFAYPEDDYDFSDWQWYVADGQDRLFDMHYDDRGYVYLAYHIFGWGIVNSNLDMDAPALSQVTASETPSGPPTVIFSFKANGRYYVIVSDGSSTSSIFETTNPSSPSHVTTMAFGILGGVPGGSPAAKIGGGSSDTVALVDTNGRVRIYSGSSLAAGGSPTNTFNPSGGMFIGVA